MLISHYHCQNGLQKHGQEGVEPKDESVATVVYLQSKLSAEKYRRSYE